MQKENDLIFTLARRLCELQAEKYVAERTLREIKSDIAETETRLSEAMEKHGDWLGVLVGVFKKQRASVARKGGGAGV